jgi:hypothetical protein
MELAHRLAGIGPSNQYIVAVASFAELYGICVRGPEVLMVRVVGSQNVPAQILILHNVGQHSANIIRVDNHMLAFFLGSIKA